MEDDLKKIMQPKTIKNKRVVALLRVTLFSILTKSSKRSLVLPISPKLICYGAILQSHRYWRQVWTAKEFKNCGEQIFQYPMLLSPIFHSPFLIWERKPFIVSDGHRVLAYVILMICRNYQTEEIAWSGVLLSPSRSEKQDHRQTLFMNGHGK